MAEKKNVFCMGKFCNDSFHGHFFPECRRKLPSVLSVFYISGTRLTETMVLLNCVLKPPVMTAKSNRKQGL